MAKKIILLNIVKNYYEIDWILPVVEELSETHDFIILFNKKKFLDELKTNSYLFENLKKITTKFYILNFFDKIILKLFGLISKFKLNFGFIKNYLLNPKIIFITKGTKLENIEFYFSDINSYSPLAGYLNEYKNRPIIVRYPNSPLIYSFYDKNQIKYSIVGDILFLNYESDKMFWSDKIELQKIKSIGTPKYQRKYLERAIKFKNKLGLKNYILVAYSSRFGLKSKDFLLEKQLVEIMDTLMETSEKKIIFKIHPRLNNKKFLKVLSKYDNKRWLVSNEHITALINNSDILLHESRSASIVEGLALNKRCIEYWDPIHKNNLNNYIENNNKISIKVKNKVELKNLLIETLSEDNEGLWKSQKNNYLKIIKKNGDPIKDFINEINKIKLIGSSSSA